MAGLGSVSQPVTSWMLVSPWPDASEGPAALVDSCTRNMYPHKAYNLKATMSLQPKYRAVSKHRFSTCLASDTSDREQASPLIKRDCKHLLGGEELGTFAEKLLLLLLKQAAMCCSNREA